MRIVRERRRVIAWKLRVYIDAIREVEATSDQDWLDAWARHCTERCIYVSRQAWIAILKKWALAEAQKLVWKQAA